jgi:hypothetical protein
VPAIAFGQIAPESGPVASQSSDKLRFVAVLSTAPSGTVPDLSETIVARLMTKHDAFLKLLLADNRVVSVRATPASVGVRATVVALDVLSRRDARQVLAEGPAVAAGVLRFDILEY